MVHKYQRKGIGEPARESKSPCQKSGSSRGEGGRPEARAQDGRGGNLRECLYSSLSSLKGRGVRRRGGGRDELSDRPWIEKGKGWKCRGKGVGH